MNRSVEMGTVPSEDDRLSWFENAEKKTTGATAELPSRLCGSALLAAGESSKERPVTWFYRARLRGIRGLCGSLAEATRRDERRKRNIISP